MNTKIETTKSLVFTRFLYASDESFLTMLSSIIDKKLEKSLFWFGEWISSVELETAKQEIWKIYYDFYAIVYPKMEKYIQKKLDSALKQKSVKKSILIIGGIIKNFIIRDADCTVFLLRQNLLNDSLKPKVYRGRRPSWIKDFDKSFQALLFSLHKQNINNVCYLLKNTEQSVNDIHTQVVKYYKDVEKQQINMDLARSKWNENSYKDKKHLLLAIVCFMNRDEVDIKLKKMFVSLTERENDLVLDPEKYSSHEGAGEGDVEPEKNPDAPYKKLEKNRLFPIDPIIGSFSLQRWRQAKPINNLLWEHWEYFAYMSPIWKARFHKFNEKYDIDHDKMRIVFADDPEDDKFEAFTEKYNYEPDEQSAEVQEKSTLEIQPQPQSTWLTKLFDIEKEKQQVNKQFVW
jgi:hypothetical protein